MFVTWDKNIICFEDSKTKIAKNTSTFGNEDTHKSLVKYHEDQVLPSIKRFLRVYVIMRRQIEHVILIYKSGSLKIPIENQAN